MGTTSSYPAGKRIGIIGLGSIGIRHAKSLVSLGVSEIFALRSMKGVIGELPQELNFIKQTTNEEEFFEQNPDGIVISNPTSLHLDALLKVLNRDIPVLVEKPIFNFAEDAGKILPDKENLIRVGFCLRFHPLTQKIKELLDKKSIGDVYLSRFDVGQYLPSWHPYTDYTTEYFSKKELGGGALRTLSHEIDLLIHYFGAPQSVDATVNKISDLQLDVDDYALLLAQYEQQTSRIEMEFLSRRSRRNGTITGTKGELSYDYIANSLLLTNNDGVTNNLSKELIEKDMYILQMIDFLNFIDSGNSAACSFREAIQCMEIISGAEKSSLQKPLLNKHNFQ